MIDPDRMTRRMIRVRRTSANTSRRARRNNRLRPFSHNNLLPLLNSNLPALLLIARQRLITPPRSMTCTRRAGPTCASCCSSRSRTTTNARNCAAPSRRICATRTWGVRDSVPHPWQVPVRFATLMTPSTGTCGLSRCGTGMAEITRRRLLRSTSSRPRQSANRFKEQDP